MPPSMAFAAITPKELMQKNGGFPAQACER